MPRLRPPSRTDPISFPVFAMSWIADPSDGTQIMAYGGGGGSAKTGVSNNIVWTANNGIPNQITTGDQVAVAVQVYAMIQQHPENKKRIRQFYLMAALGNKVRRYRIPQQDCKGEVDVGEPVNALAVNHTASLLAVGCDSGIIKVYPLQADFPGIIPEPLSVLEQHTKAVCALHFSVRNHRLVASSKDGTASVWQQGRLLDVQACEVPDTKKNAQILVRGCAFADLHGCVILTVASARRGKAYLSQWMEVPVETPNGKSQQAQKQQQLSGRFRLTMKTPCSNHPISAMSLSQDGGLIALGSVNGSIILWGVQEWKPLLTFDEVHDLPVTCIAARPFAMPMFKGEEDEGITVHARSASADSKLGLLTWQRRAAKKQVSDSGEGFSLGSWLYRLIKLIFISTLLKPIVNEARFKCMPVYRDEGLRAVPSCLRYKFLLAPPDAPGVARPPF